MPGILSRVIAILATACLLAASWTGIAAAADPFTGYLMAHFTGESANGEQIYLAHSDDGLHWTDLNNGSPVLVSTVGTRASATPSSSAPPRATGTGSSRRTCGSPPAPPGTTPRTGAAPRSWSGSPVTW
ncbi:hypothetical protein [Actinomadura sp. 7K534]|uniref:hypothetical protein n=1 Tax=Actinomadura sp. 7K534 TaxID=2530366 RepID=UPI001A9CEB47|nr:hypothetical protein [Actinomadura sp. 7K534]